jgi:hypothetical protein
LLDPPNPQWRVINEDKTPPSPSVVEELKAEGTLWCR